MNDSSKRDFAAICVIVLAVCIGGWMVLVEPVASKLGRLEASIAESEVRGSQFTEIAVKKMADQLQSVRERITEIHDRNGLAGDSANLYATIKTMADDQNVVLRSHNLSEVGNSSRNNDAAAAVSLHVEVSGRYEDVAAFLQDVLELDGFVRLKSVALSPTTRDEQLLTSAVLRCEALSFTVPEALISMQGDTAGDS